MPKGASSEDLEAKIAAALRTLVEKSVSREVVHEADVIELYSAGRSLFRALLRRDGVSERVILALLTKFNDAGPRSAPWKAVSSKVPGRPQDGKDGNRMRRWEFPVDHKFYSTRKDGTLVAIKYMFQALSMTGAPETPAAVSERFSWLVGHDVRPGAFLDPIQKIGVRLADVVENPQIITSGHIVPLDRGGRHVPSNTSLILKRSNDLQGNNTMDELLELIKGILVRHGRR